MNKSIKNIFNAALLSVFLLASCGSESEACEIKDLPENVEVQYEAGVWMVEGEVFGYSEWEDTQIFSSSSCI